MALAIHFAMDVFDHKQNKQHAVDKQHKPDRQHRPDRQLVVEQHAVDRIVWIDKILCRIRFFCQTYSEDNGLGRTEPTFEDVLEMMTRQENMWCWFC
jgi:hypothetical protein